MSFFSKSFLTILVVVSSFMVKNWLLGHLKHMQQWFQNRVSSALVEESRASWPFTSSVFSRFM